TSGGAAPGASQAAAAPETAYLPRAVQLKAQELIYGSRKLTHLAANMTRYASGNDEGWRVQLAADQAQGEIDYREPRGPVSAGRIHARLQRLSLPKADAEGVEGLLEQAPASVPALDVQVDDFELRGKKLGRLVIEAVNRSGSGVESA